MVYQFLMFGAAVLGASALQSATGIGFGVVAGPILLLMLDSGAAIQISIALSLLIAVVLLPSLWPRVDRQLLLRLLIGSALGLPIGLSVFLLIPVDLLKLLAGLAVLFSLALVLAGPRLAGRWGLGQSRVAGDLAAGIASGLMSGSLAMPGPVPAARMAANGQSKDVIRGTIMTLFICSYGAAFALQLGLAGIEPGTWRLMLILAPPTLVGVVIGRVLAGRLTERVFRWVVAAVLAATGVSLLLNALLSLT